MLACTTARRMKSQQRMVELAVEQSPFPSHRLRALAALQPLPTLMQLNAKATTPVLLLRSLLRISSEASTCHLQYLNMLRLTHTCHCRLRLLLANSAPWTCLASPTLIATRPAQTVIFLHLFQPCKSFTALKAWTARPCLKSISHDTTACSSLAVWSNNPLRRFTKLIISTLPAQSLPLLRHILTMATLSDQLAHHL